MASITSNICGWTIIAYQKYVSSTFCYTFVRGRKKTYVILFSLNLAKGLLRSCATIQTLVLSDNAITRLSAQMFANSASLSHLGLDKNLLEDLPPGLFANTSNLKVLDLSHNRFSDLPEAVNASALQNLQSLSLSGNLIGSLGNLRMPSLWRLEVSDNRQVSKYNRRKKYVYCISTFLEKLVSVFLSLEK